MLNRPEREPGSIPLLEFPAEITLGIFGCLKWDTSTLAAIARTCKAVQHDVYTVLYQYFSSSDLEAHLLFFRTLQRNPKTRLYVRTYVCPPIGAAIDNILASRHRMPARNPQLSKTTLMQSIKSALESMVNLRALVMVNIGTDQHGVLSWLDECARVVSPELEALAGNSHVLYAFMTNNSSRPTPRKIVRVHIEPDARIGYNSTVHDRKAMGKPDALGESEVQRWMYRLRALSLGGYYGRSKLTDVIAQSLPSLEYLELIGPYKKTDLEAVAHFPRLFYLFLSSHSGASGQPMNPRFDDIPGIIAVLFASCKRLQYVYIHDQYQGGWAEYQVWHLGVKEDRNQRIDELDDVRRKYMRWD